MSATETPVEERVTALEEQVAKLRAQIEQIASKPAAAELPWWERIAGVFENVPEFDEAVRLGQEWRYADRPADEDGDTPDQESGQ
jgi:phage shock protein A